MSIIDSSQVSASIDLDIQLLKDVIEIRILDISVPCFVAPLNRVVGTVSAVTSALGTIQQSIQQGYQAISNIAGIVSTITQIGTQLITNSINALTNIIFGTINNIIIPAGICITQGIINTVSNVVWSGIEKFVRPLENIVIINAGLAFENVNAFRKNVNNLRIDIDLRTIPTMLPSVPAALAELNEVFTEAAAALYDISQAGKMLVTQITSVIDELEKNLINTITDAATSLLGTVEGELLSAGIAIESSAPMSQMSEVNSLEVSIGSTPTDFSGSLASIGLDSSGNLNMSSSAFGVSISDSNISSNYVAAKTAVNDTITNMQTQLSTIKTNLYSSAYSN